MLFVTVKGPHNGALCCGLVWIFVVIILVLLCVAICCRSQCSVYAVLVLGADGFTASNSTYAAAAAAAVVVVVVLVLVVLVLKAYCLNYSKLRWKIREPVVLLVLVVQ